ncbi:MAG: hypothetical protein MI923_00360 [Phycisphaerales bacterium]|nr:hypothetical protein [Phycisphaerales bacterium]
MTSIYIAWYTIDPAPFDAYYNKHLYLVKDPNSDTSAGNTSDQSIIRGGDGDNADFRSGWAHFPGNPADLIIENGFSSAASVDGLDNPNVDTDYNEDGNDDTAADRHYTSVNLAPALSNMDFDFDSDGTVTADEVWAAMEDYATSLSGLYKYGFFDINCQATAVSVLSSVGIDFGINTPTGSSYSQYVGRNVLLDGAGATKLTAFYDPAQHWDYHRRNGQDTLILEHDASIEIIDQLDTNGHSEFTGLTTVVLEGWDFRDLDVVAGSNDDLLLKEGSATFVTVQDYFKTHNDTTAERAETIAFEFEDKIFRMGDDFNNVLDSSTAT